MKKMWNYHLFMVRKLNPVFIRYLMILFLFSALLLIVFIPVYLYFYNFTLSNELAFIYDRLHQGVSSLDTALIGINNIAILTNRDSRFNIFTQDRQNLELYPFLLRELREHFSGIVFTHPVIADAGIVFSRDIVLTRRQVFFFPEIIPFYGNYIQIEGLTEDEWFSIISKTNTLSNAMKFSSMGQIPYTGLNYTVQ